MVNGGTIRAELFQDGKFGTVRVNKEVVISAGTMKSPHILLNSGIGPKEHLESVGVEVVKDLPGVGENLHNHVSYQLSFTMDESDLYDNNWEVSKQYYNSQTGPLSATGLNQMAAILATNATTNDYPDLQIFVGGFASTCAPGGVDAQQSTGRRAVTLSPTFLHTKSKGKFFSHEDATV